MGLGGLQIRFLLEVNILAALSDLIHKLEPGLDCSPFRVGKHTGHRAAKHLRIRRLPIQYKLTETARLDIGLFFCCQILHLQRQGEEPPDVDGSSCEMA